jgi:hypothetical protein
VPAEVLAGFGSGLDISPDQLCSIKLDNSCPQSTLFCDRQIGAACIVECAVIISLLATEWAMKIPG